LIEALTPTYDIHLRHTIIKLTDILLLGSAYILLKYHFTMQSHKMGRQDKSSFIIQITSLQSDSADANCLISHLFPWLTIVP